MLRVLLVDGDALEFQLIDLIFRDAYRGTYLLSHAQTMEEAEQILTVQQFDIILLDDGLSNGAICIQNTPVLASLVQDTSLCIFSKEIDAAYLKEKVILEVYDAIDKFDLRTRLKNTLAA